MSKRVDSKSKELNFIGKKVDFKIAIQSTSGELFSFQKGQKYILFFYPKDMTSGCTIENEQFNKFKSQIGKLGYQIIGVSRDSIKSHQRFVEKLNLKFDLLSDDDEMLCNFFEVIKEKNMYGKKVIGIERSTFVINEFGEIIHEWRKVKADGHAEEVLQSLKK